MGTAGNKHPLPSMAPGQELYQSTPTLCLALASWVSVAQALATHCCRATAARLAWKQNSQGRAGQGRHHPFPSCPKLLSAASHRSLSPMREASRARQDFATIHQRPPRVGVGSSVGTGPPACMNSGPASSTLVPETDRRHCPAQETLACPEPPAEAHPMLAAAYSWRGPCCH
jgi:hypothetical protein